MCHWRGLALGLLAVLLLGCTTTKPVRSTTWLDRFKRGVGPTGSDVVALDVAIIERPAGDRYLNDDLWTAADEQVVLMERRAILEDNGFRVGQVGGLTPAPLQELLSNKRSNPAPRHRELHAAKPVPLDLGPARPVCEFQVQRDGEPTTIRLEQAQCTLEVTPTLTADGRVKLTFVPQVVHGEATLMPRPAPDGSGWMLPQTRPTERYATMAWEVNVPPNDYVVIGTRYGQEQTLGHQCFVTADNAAAVQRLLVIRTSRAAPVSDESVASEDGGTLWTPPLASQATMNRVRGTAP